MNHNNSTMLFCLIIVICGVFRFQSISAQTFKVERNHNASLERYEFIVRDETVGEECNQGSHQRQVDEEYLIPHPVIGVLAQKSSPDDIHGGTYIMSNYIKLVEMAGALVVPIRIDESEEYYREMFSHINGVIYPGGGVDLMTSGYAKAARIIHTLALEANDRGDFFPVLGICLGFQLLTTLTLNQNVLVKCNEEDIARPLNFTNHFREGKFYRELPEYLEKEMRLAPVTYNNHQYCLAAKTYESFDKLKSFFRVLSTNVGRNGTHYVSTMEAYKYPIFGVQWHPEKNTFQWNIRSHIDHSEDAVEVTQYIANFFISQARKSKHRFPDVQTASDNLINNFSPFFAGAPTFSSKYYFY